MEARGLMTYLQDETARALDVLRQITPGTHVEQLMYLLHRRLMEVETKPPPPTPAPTPASSVATPGPAEKLSRSGTVSHREIGEPTLRAIMVGSKSMRSMLPELVEYSEDSSSLTLTLRWPSPSGEKSDGQPGPASHEPSDSGLSKCVCRYSVLDAELTAAALREEALREALEQLTTEVVTIHRLTTQNGGALMGDLYMAADKAREALALYPAVEKGAEV